MKEKDKKLLTVDEAVTDDKLVGVGVGFNRIHRITGYLVGDDERWNDAKRAELNDRVKHEMGKF